jgi:ABC-2 type transport system ATP-binding protein
MSVSTPAGEGAGSTAPLVRVQGLTKIYTPSPLWMRFLLRSAIRQPIRALDNISFEVGAGTVCAVVGPNGAGKSTLFRILTGLTTPDEGTATVCGLNSDHDAHQVRRRVGFVPADDRSLYLRHTARENLYFHGNLQGMETKGLIERCNQALEVVGLEAAGDRIGFALSAGMRARLQLARALLHEPPVLILDEPTGSVDPVGSYHLLKVIERVAVDRGLAVLISSHRLEEIEALHDDVLLLDQGQLVHRGDLDSLRRTYEISRLSLRFAAEDGAAGARAALDHLAGVEVIQLEGVTVTIETELTTGRLLQLLDGQLADLESVQPTRISLGELLARVVEQQKAVREERAQERAGA